MVPENHGICLNQREYAFFAIEAAHKENRLWFTQSLARKKQIRIYPVRYHMSFRVEHPGSRSKRATQIFAADGYGIQLRRQCIQHLACPVTQMIILQMKNDCSPISKLA